MSIAVSISQLLLALIFASAGVAKLLDVSATEGALEGFGVPEALRPTGAILIPLAEFAVAAALIPAATGRFGALAAAVLLVVFSVAMIRVLLSGSAPDCNCFGGAAQTRVGRGALLRNGVLTVAAGFVLLGGESVGALHWITVPAPGDRVVIFCMAAVIVGLSCFCWMLLRQNGRLLREMDSLDDGSVPGSDRGVPVALPTGMPAPDFTATYLDGAPVSRDSLLSRGLPVAMFFTDPGCGACDLVLDAVAEVQSGQADRLTLVVISGGVIDRIKQKSTEFGLDQVIPQTDQELFDRYRVNGFPALIHLTVDGTIVGPPALGADPVRASLLAANVTPVRAMEVVA
ncbi:MAG: peroxiredoxin family protein [Solirubrobacterales bacterium]